MGRKEFGEQRPYFRLRCLYVSKYNFQSWTILKIKLYFINTFLQKNHFCSKDRCFTVEWKQFWCMILIFYPLFHNFLLQNHGTKKYVKWKHIRFTLKLRLLIHKNFHLIVKYYKGWPATTLIVSCISCLKLINDRYSCNSS